MVIIKIEIVLLLPNLMVAFAACFFFFCFTKLKVRLTFAVGDEGANSNDSNWSMECSTVLRVKTLHISSPILAAKSPFFYKVKLTIF